MKLTATEKDIDMSHDNADNSDQRRFTRIPFDAKVALTFSKGSTEVVAEGVLVDISLKGLMVELPEVISFLSEDMEGHANIHLASSTIELPMEVTIRHIEKSTIGLHVEQMPIESAEHLKNLMKHNLGSESMLQRELHALVSN
ncbi:MAG TPA: PilZ domain-containing protein [Gammaproteobacteria bacterium]|nr:PilZ domain-containing protein [Gammaproteobacteria bacterium]HCK93021.1 PilZ domain-containing protein [Gammaproteobacteria bacterium]|tara:strand:- start:539 stop:967 length:429 start_codon:yes stop_codon:yes gene_type:complete